MGQVREEGDHLVAHAHKRAQGSDIVGTRVISDGGNSVVCWADPRGINEVASKFHGLADFQFSTAEGDAVGAAAIKDCSDAGDEFLLGVSENQNVVNKLDDAVQSHQGCVCALAKPVAGRAETHRGHGVGITGPGEEEGCEELAVRVEGKLEISMDSIEFAKPLATLRDHFANRVGGRKRMYWPLDELVEFYVVCNEADLVRSARLGDKVASTQPRCGGILTELENNAFSFQLITESTSRAFEMCSDRARRGNVVWDDLSWLETYVQRVAHHSFIRGKVVVEDVWIVLDQVSQEG